MNKSLRLALLLVPMLATWAFAGIYFEMEMEGPDLAGTPPKTHRIACYISGPKIRAGAQGPATNGITITCWDKRKRYQLDPNNKTYIEGPTSELGQEEEAQVRTSVTKTKETKKIGNYNCTRYDIIQSGPGMPPEGVTNQYWMTTDVDVVDEFEKFSDAENATLPPKVATELAKVKGFPMQVVTKVTSGKMSITSVMTVTTVKKQDIPDSMFEVPADYKKTTMPAPAAAPPAAPAPGGAGAGKGE